MKNYKLSDEDAQQVEAILLTHAELQDRQAIANEELRGRLAREADEEGDVIETLEDLTDIHETLEADRDNLQRIARIFQ